MKIAILGFGTVGSGVYEIAKSLKNIEVKKVLEKDLSKIDIATDNYDEIINDKEIELVVECMGGLHPAYEFIMKALQNKKSVVSANKAVIAKYLDEFLKRFSYKAMEIDSLETQLTDINGEPKERIIQGLVGIMKDERIVTPDNFLYDTVVFDSGKEKENIESSNIKEVVVFGKIPRKSIQVPLYFGGTTSPDFMYIVKKDNDYQLNLIVETKDVKKNSDIRGEEEHRIFAAKEFFKQLKADGLNISFKKQIKSDDIIKIIKDLIENERQD